MKSPDDHHARQALILLTAIVDLAEMGVAKGFIRGKMLWAVSLYLECGQCKEHWPSYQRISDAARPVRDSKGLPWEERKGKLRFEHSRPLKQMYEMLVREASSLDFERAAQIIGEYPPVLILRSEDDDIPLHLKSSGAPEERYKGIPISGFTLRSDRWRHFFARMTEIQKSSSLTDVYALDQDPQAQRPSEVIGVHIAFEMLKSLDDWRGKQHDLPSRAEAIRRLVEIGLRTK